MPLLLRYMRLADIPAVIAIDKQSFDPSWSEKSYAYEIAQSTYSHMLVLEQTARPQAPKGWRRLLRSGASGGDLILGYGGLWNISDEGHISTIAVHPDHRGRGYGEILLMAMIQRAILLGAAYLILEVRVSNTVAQNLYHKHGFIIEERKPKYYQSNQEDAYAMRLELRENREYLARFAALYRDLKARHALIDEYTEGRAPNTR
ncbi:MAG: ribosomal protein S18-alanine N-acetyltransferase [Candidatus Flexifilum sp.]